MKNYNSPFNLNSKQQSNDEKIRYDLFNKSIHAATLITKDKYEFINSEGFDPFILTFIQSPIITIDIKSPKFILLSDCSGNYIIIELNKVTDDEKPIIQKLLTNNAIKVFKEGKAVLKILLLEGYHISLPFFDITLAGLILDSGLGDVSDYESVVAKYVKSVPRNDKYLNWNYSITKSHINSVADNAALMFELMAVLKAGLAIAGLSPTAALEFSCLPAIVEMEFIGIGFDEEKWIKVEENIYKEMLHLEKELKSILGSYNFEEADQFTIAVNNYGIPVKSVSKDNLSEYSLLQYPIIKTLQDYLSVRNLVKKYYKSFYIYLSKHDNRLYSTYNQIRSTGRIYCEDPNIQQWPKRKDFRECIIAPNGKKFIDADYSQIDLKSASEITCDPVMIKAFQDGIDLHRLTASFVYDKEPEDITKEERQSAKVINFGLIYGMSALGLKRKIKEECDIAISEMQAELFIIRFFQRYSGIKKWQDSIVQMNINETHTLLGRRRLWKNNDALKYALFNSPIQGTSADVFKKALSLLVLRLRPVNGLIVGVIHDEIICEVPEEYAIECEQILRKTMIEAGEFFIKSVPILVETVIADNWAGK